MHELKDFNKYILEGSSGIKISKSEVETIQKLGMYGGLEYRRVPVGVEVVDGNVVRKYEIAEDYLREEDANFRLLNLLQGMTIHRIESFVRDLESCDVNKEIYIK